MTKLLTSLKTIIPEVTLVASDNFYYSPLEQIVYYVDKDINKESGRYALLHECGHALLHHQNYLSDFQLLQMEVLAWEKAKTLADKLKLKIDEDHIQDCLDSYRDWLHKRSLCPKCSFVGLSSKRREYNCINCNHFWKISDSKFNRTYRSSSI